MSEDVFDYIILGAGTAGCVLAGRLTEDPSIRVCLVEAGPRDSSWKIHVPAAVGSLLFHKRLGWGYKTAPQANLNGRQVFLPRGRVLGGSSSTNGMVYYRGHPTDYDDWAAAGNPGWSYREVLPYFRRSENNENWPDSPYHGVGGPMNVMDLKQYNPLIGPFLEACDSLQLPRCRDFNGANPEGVGPRQATIRNGRRESEATAYLRPAEHRENLKIITGALVRRVLLEGRRATGAEIEIDGHAVALTARRETVLCGGAFGSPAILMRSGIGPAERLRSLGIAVAHDLPAVGANLHDHLSTAIERRTESPDSYGLSLRALPRGIWNVLEYLVARRGPIAGNVFEATGFLRTLSTLARPDVQLVFMPAVRNPSGFPIPIGHGYCINTVNLYPKSRGSVTLADADPHSPPVIDPNLLGDPEDYGPLVRGMRLARRILAAPAFERYQAREILPGPAVEDEEAIKDYIRRTATTVHHPCSTCRMGGDEASVVDPELRVRGIAGLRVADASIFPSVVGGNTNAAVVMIGEKATDLLLGRPAPPPAILPAA